MPSDTPTLAPLPAPPTAEETAASTLRTVLIVLAMLVLGGVVGYVVGQSLLNGGAAAEAASGAASGAGWSPGPLALAAFMALQVAMLVVVLGVHELGHLVGGWLAGFRFFLFVVGPLQVRRAAGDAVEVGWNRSLALAGGLAASLPTTDHVEDSDALRRGLTTTVAGGPALSLAFALAAFGLDAALGALDVAAGDGPAGLFVRKTLFVTGLGSLGIFAVTLLPARTSGFYTDGMRLWRLWRGGPSALRDDAVVLLGTLSMSGVRPRDWPDALVDRALGVAHPALDDGSLFACLAHQYAYARALDGGEAEAAADHLRAALAGYAEGPDVLKAGLALEAAYVEGALRGDAEAARAWRETAPASALTNATTQHRADAAVALAEADPDAARDAIAAARDALPRALDQGLAAAEADWLDALAARTQR
jgi:hypothetical protein